MKEYYFSWRTVPPAGSVYYKGVLTVTADYFDEAMDEAEKIIRGKSKKFIDIPLKIIEKGEDS